MFPWTQELPGTSPPPRHRITVASLGRSEEPSLKPKTRWYLLELIRALGDRSTSNSESHGDRGVTPAAHEVVHGTFR